jgi:cell division septation protein DedD
LDDASRCPDGNGRVLVAAGGLVTATRSLDDGGGSSTTASQTSPTFTGASTSPTPVASPPQTTSTPVASQTPEPSPTSSRRPARSSKRPDDWPGGSGYTTILASLPSKAAALRVQAMARGRGLDAGVLYSTRYSSLRPGYWVVFSGKSAGQQKADRRTARAKSLGYKKAYPRFVSR